jgi:hypothetical protein
MTQQVSSRVLRASASEMGTNAEKDRRCQLPAHPINGNAPYHLEANAVDERFSQCCELRLQGGHNEGFGAKVRDVTVSGKECACGVLHLRNFHRR